MTPNRERELLGIEQMAAELAVDPAWIEVQVEAGLIPAVRRDDRLWFRPGVVRMIVADWRAHLVTVDDSHATEPLPAVRCCDEVETMMHHRDTESTEKRGRESGTKPVMHHRDTDGKGMV
jgi:hypothetical protein